MYLWHMTRSSKRFTIGRVKIGPVRNRSCEISNFSGWFVVGHARENFTRVAIGHVKKCRFKKNI